VSDQPRGVSPGVPDASASTPFVVNVRCLRY